MRLVTSTRCGTTVGRAWGEERLDDEGDVQREDGGVPVNHSVHGGPPAGCTVLREGVHKGGAMPGTWWSIGPRSGRYTSPASWIRTCEFPPAVSRKVTGSVQRVGCWCRQIID